MAGAFLRNFVGPQRAGVPMDRQPVGVATLKRRCMRRKVVQLLQHRSNLDRLTCLLCLKALKEEVFVRRWWQCPCKNRATDCGS